MTRIFARCALASVAVLGATFGAGLYAQAADRSQLAAAAGIPAAEAATMSLTEIAAAKFNRDTRGDDQQVVSEAQATAVDPVRHAQLIAAARLSGAEAAGMTLTQLAAGTFNAGSDDDDAQTVVTMSSRGPVRVGSHLAFAAGLTPEEAEGMSLSAIAAAKFNRDTRDDDRQTAGF
jgi:hypothetical protein